MLKEEWQALSRQPGFSKWIGLDRTFWMANPFIASNSPYRAERRRTRGC